MVDQVCTFLVNEMYFGIDVPHVREVIRPQPITPVPLAPADTLGLINLRSQIITVIDLQRRLGMESSHPSSFKQDNSLGFNIIVEADHDVVSFVVDAIGDVLAFPEHSLEPPPATLKGRMRQMLAGAYSLDEGFLLILDTRKVLESRPVISIT